MLGADAAIMGVGKGFTVSESDLLTKHPNGPLTVAEYTDVKAGLTEMEAVLEPVFQVKEPILLPVMFIIADLPKQISEGEEAN